MFTRRDSFNKTNENSNILDSQLPPIKMTLANSSLYFDNTWKLDNAEFDKAANEIDKVLNERDALLINLREAMFQIKNLKLELTEVQDMNKAALDMVQTAYIYV